MQVLRVTAQIRDVVLAAIRPGEARPARTLASLGSIVHCDPEHVVAELWDMVEDGILTYHADGTFRRLRA